MKPIIHLDHIAAINQFIPHSFLHPLVAVIDFSKADEYIPEGTKLSADFYSIMFKNYCRNTVRYGRQTFDFQDGSLVCIAPKQVITLDTELEKNNESMGWGLFFHPDLLRGTSLGTLMHTYTFFSYETAEALHLSDKEKMIVFKKYKPNFPKI